MAKIAGGFLVVMLFASACVLMPADNAPAVQRYVPEDAAFTLRLAGPERWRGEFEDTGLGKVVAAQELRDVWSELFAALVEQFEMEGEPLRIAEEMWQQLADYRGDVLATGIVDWDRLVSSLESNLDQLPGALLLAFGPDEGLSANELAESMRKRLDQHLGATDAERMLDGVSAPMRDLGRAQMVGPCVHEGSVLLLVCDDVERVAPAFFRPRESVRLADAAAAAPLYFEVDVRPIFELSMELLRIDPQSTEFAADLVSGLGFESLQSFSLALAAEGRDVVQTMQLEFAGERGVFDVVLPARSEPPSLLRYLPKDAGTFGSGQIDGAGIEPFLRATVAQLGDAMPLSMAELEGMVTQYLKIDLFRDVLQQIGDEYLRIDDVVAAFDIDTELDPVEEEVDERFGDSCYVLAVRDGKQLAKTLDTAIRARGLHVGRKREAYGDVTIYRMNPLGVLPLEYAVTDELLLIGVGQREGTKRNLRRVLDAVAANATEAPFSEPVRCRLASFPPGWAGMDVASLREAMSGIAGVADTLEALLAAENLTFEDLEQPAWRVVRKLHDRLLPLLQQHGVETAVSVDYVHADRFVQRARW